MPAYKVQAAEHKGPKPDRGYGPMQVIKLALEGDDGQVQQAEWFTKATTPVPPPGAQLIGDLSPSQFGGLNFKKAQSIGGGGFGPRPEDPKRSARIQRMHSQDMALQTIRLAYDIGNILEVGATAELFALVAKTADWFDKDAQAAGDRA